MFECEYLNYGLSDVLMYRPVPVTDVDSESNRSSDCSNNEDVKKWEPSVRWSSVLVVILSITLAGVCLSAIVFYLISQAEPKPCLSEDCVATASRIVKAMDRSIDPCNDFYQFACGGWEKLNPVPEWSTTWDQLALLREGLSKDLRVLLEEESEEELPKSVIMAKQLYKSCMDVDQIEADGVEPIKQTLELIGLTPYPPGYWPDGENMTVPFTLKSTLNETNETEVPENKTVVNIPYDRKENSTDGWQKPAGRARRLLGLAALVGIHVTEDVRNNSQNRLVVEQVSPGFSEKYLNNPQKFANEITQFKKYISSMVKLYSPTIDGDQFAEEILTFSTGLAQIMTPSEVRRSGTHLFHEVSVRQFIEGANGGPESWKNMHLDEYLHHTFQNTNIVLKPKEDRVIVMDLPYLQKLSVMLAATEPLVIEKFLWWSVFSTIAPLTMTTFRDLGFTFSKEVFGLQQRTPRWKSCTTNVNSNFGLALSFLYVRKHFDQTSRQKAIEMLEDVRDAFSETVNKVDWMDNTTRNKTLSKLKAIRNYIGFPSWLLTEKKLDEHYKDIEVSDTDKLFDTYIKLTNHSVTKNLESLREKPDRNRWIATPTTVNAFYSATLNSVTFPAGILQPPFYGNGLESINYGSIGAIMGHEVTHGFDDQGRRYDETGNLKQWWSAATLEHYHGKVQCIIDQYNQYHMTQLPNYTVHGFNTQGENIADNGGLRAAHKAYSLYTMRNVAAKRYRLPSMENYSQEQLFYLGFAQIWCGNSTVGALKSKLVEGVHSPNKIRVIGTLSNSKEFSDAWKCPLGSPMNPEHKCVLW